MMMIWMIIAYEIVNDYCSLSCCVVFLVSSSFVSFNHCIYHICIVSSTLLLVGPLLSPASVPKRHRDVVLSDGH